MQKFKEKLEFYIMYFSFKERKKREHKRFKESIKELKKLGYKIKTYEVDEIAEL